MLSIYLSLGHLAIPLVFLRKTQYFHNFSQDEASGKMAHYRNKLKVLV